MSCNHLGKICLYNNIYNNIINLDYKFKKLIGRNDFSFQFRNKKHHALQTYRRMRRSAYLDFNPIMVDNYVAFFYCTPVDRASDSMMTPT